MRNQDYVRLRPMSFIGSLTLIGCVLGGLACSDQPTGGFGPPSGFAVVAGMVTHGDGTPVDKGMEVALTSCTAPVGGFAGSTLTETGGGFSVRGAMPPIGMPEGQDSVRATCEVFAGRGFAESGPLDVYFFRPPREPTLLEVNLSGP